MPWPCFIRAETPRRSCWQIDLIQAGFEGRQPEAIRTVRGHEPDCSPTEIRTVEDSAQALPLRVEGIDLAASGDQQSRIDPGQAMYPLEIIKPGMSQNF